MADIAIKAMSKFQIDKSLVQEYALNQDRARGRYLPYQVRSGRMITRVLVFISLVLSPIAHIIPTAAHPAVVYALPPVSTAADSSANHAQAASALQSASVMFIENVGQFDNGARFQLRGHDYTIWLAEDAIWLTIMGPNSVNEDLTQDDIDHTDRSYDQVHAIRLDKGITVKLNFVGATSNPRIEPFSRTGTRVSYFQGNDPSQWHANVPVWNGVRYTDLYPGIDLEIVGENGQIVPRLLTRSGADPSVVRLRVEGANDIKIDGNFLHLITAIGDFSFPLFQVITTNGVPSAHGHRLLQASVRGNEIVAPFSYDSTLFNLSTQGSSTSGLAYSTFLGGSNVDDANAVVVDMPGSAYIIGVTQSADFPTTSGVFSTTYAGGGDVFVAKLNANGSALIYATFLGGSGLDEGKAIALDEGGNVYITGRTSSSNFPVTAGAYDMTFNGSEDAFVVKLDASGSTLVYSTFLGGPNSDQGWNIAVDQSEAAYVTGNSAVSGFPTTPGAFQTTSHNAGGYIYYDAFATKLNAAGNGLVYSTYLSGSGNEFGNSIAVDGTGNAYVVGRTASSDYPVSSGAFDTTFGGGTCDDVFVTKMNSAGSAPDYSTFLGGTSCDYGYGIALGPDGTAYVTGATHSSDYPVTPGAFQPAYHAGYYDAFVTRLNASGANLIYSTILGGGSDDYGNKIAIDATGAVYLAGYTLSSDFPVTTDAFQATNRGSEDAFLTKLNPPGSELIYSTYLGDSGRDFGRGVAVDASAGVYVVGYTTSSGFPVTQNAFDVTYSNGDAFATKLIEGPGFLSLPVAYTNFADAAQGSKNGQGPGRINSWFDHTYPTYASPPNAGTNDLTIWAGPYTGTASVSESCIYGESCYDGHNGIDFQKRMPDEPVLAAASGIVTNIVFSTTGYGNHLWIDHRNGYATLYGHLKSISVTEGSNVITSQPLGIMGNTGVSSGGDGIHLHFGLYYDYNNDGHWAENEVADPYGWQPLATSSSADPCTVSTPPSCSQSRYLWKYPLNPQTLAGSSGGTITSASGNASIVVPPSALTSTVTLELWNAPVAGASGQLRSTGNSFWLRVLEWIPGSTTNHVQRAASGFTQPLTLTIIYTDTEVLHLDRNQLAIYHWQDNNTWMPLTSTVNIAQNQVTANTLDIGSFDLQAPLLCSIDNQEPNDNYYAARVLSVNGAPVTHLFDIEQDEDWFRLNAVAGTEYVIQTDNLAPGVDTIIELYDLDGVTMLASDDNGNGGKASRLQWAPPQDGTYFIRLAQSVNSTYGCTATYQLSANRVFQPSNLSITGPITGTVHAPYEFIATVSPVTATQPITYFWQATEQLAITNTGELSDTATFTWTIPGFKSISVRAANGDGEMTGTYAITIGVGPLTNIMVDPTSLTMTVGMTQAFTAIGEDAFGNSVSISPVWSTNAGTITGNILTAQTVPASGRHVSATVGNISGTAVVNVVAGPLSHLVITPAHVTLNMHTSQEFTATGFDAYDNIASGLTLTWQVTPTHVGSIDATGLFTAGAKVGEYPNAILVASDAVSATASVVIRWPYQVYLPVVLR